MEELLEKARQLSILKTSQKLPDYKRFLYEDVKNNNGKVIGIYGSRGIGKTTLLLQILKSLNLSIREAIYISCDHPIFTDINLFEFLQFFYQKGGRVIFIDEIHKIKDFQKHLKSAYDFLDLKIYFSGSSAIKISNPDFTRRFSMFHMPILSLREYIELALNINLKSYKLEEILKYHDIIAQEIINSLPEKRILTIFEDYKEFGAYPFYFEDKEKFFDKLQDTIDAILYYDLAELYNINWEKLHTIKKLLISICQSKPLELSVDKLIKLIGLSKTTFYKYIKYLSRGELIIHILHEAKRYKDIKKPDKLYLANTNLFKALCLKSDIGTLRETFFASMLKYKHSIYYTDKGDFLVDEIYTFEIGGRSKTYSQIKNVKNSYLALDDIEIGFERKIPLWIFGFLY